MFLFFNVVGSEIHLKIQPDISVSADLDSACIIFRNRRPLEEFVESFSGQSLFIIL